MESTRYSDCTAINCWDHFRGFEFRIADQSDHHSNYARAEDRSCVEDLESC